MSMRFGKFRKKHGMLGLFGFGALAVVALFTLSYATPSKYESFAQCLGERDATFYGAFWCSHCQEQKQLFGTAKDMIPYVECSTPDGQNQVEECTKANISGYPTWVFADGEKRGGVQTLSSLAEKTGCALPQ